MPFVRADAVRLILEVAGQLGRDPEDALRALRWPEDALAADRVPVERLIALWAWLTRGERRALATRVADGVETEEGIVRKIVTYSTTYEVDRIFPSMRGPGSAITVPPNIT